MSKLYIIGNGFDINHSLPTKYSDFLKYVCFYHHNEFHRIGSMFGNGDPSYLWKDLENHLADFDVKGSVVRNVPRLIEEARRNTDRRRDDYTLLKNACDGLFFHIEHLLQYWVQDTLIDVKVEKKYILSSMDYYLTFNYTNLLEAVYHIPSSQICYIHKDLSGNVDEKEPIPVYGHGYSDEELKKRVSLDAATEKAITDIDVDLQIIKDIYMTLLKDFRKRTNNQMHLLNNLLDQINMNDIDGVFILGHSMGLSDTPYFKKLACKIPTTIPIIISYKKDEEKDELYSRVSDIFGNSERISCDKMENLLQPAGSGL